MSCQRVLIGIQLLRSNHRTSYPVYVDTGDEPPWRLALYSLLSYVY